MLPFVLWCSLAFAEDFIPANFRTGSHSLESNIRFPKNTPDGILVIKCAGYVLANGRLSLKVFYESPNKHRKSVRRFQRAIAVASRWIKLTPASVNGERKEVWFNFSVVFRKFGDKQTIEVYPSHLYDIDKYEKTYTDPQRYGFNNWPRGCGQFTFFVSADVDSTGKASDAKVIVGSAPSRCERKIVDFIENNSYIPATHNGEYVTAKYVEIFFD